MHWKLSSQISSLRLNYNNNLSQKQDMPIELCPIVRPSLEEFSNFYQFTHFLDRTYKNHFGMVKVVPPQGWRGTLPNYQAALQRLTVSHPIEQNVQGAGGYFEARNIVQSKMTFRAYRKYAERQSSSVANHTPEEKERLFWKTVMYSPPIYGADLTGTLMDEGAGDWNMNSLNSLLGYAMPYRVRGVTEPYCYIGTWKAFFSWHKEDLDLSAINYIHQGQPKIWYAIAPEDGHILEEAARKHYPSQYLQCPQFLRHKTFLINPEVLLKEYPSLRICKAVHSEGEMMLVFGGAYHEGFNCGFNIAEAVNYATLDWLRQLLVTHSCTCSRRAVRTEIESILYNLEQSDMFETLLSTDQFMLLRAHVQHLQELEQGIKEQQKPQLQIVEQSKVVKDHGVRKQKSKGAAKSKPIHKHKKNKCQETQKSTVILPASDSLLQQVGKCIIEVEETKKSCGNQFVHDRP